MVPNCFSWDKFIIQKFCRTPYLKVNNTSDIQNMNIWHSTFCQFFEHRAAYLLVVTTKAGRVCSFQTFPLKQSQPGFARKWSARKWYFDITGGSYFSGKLELIYDFICFKNSQKRVLNIYLKAPQAFRWISGISCVSRATRGAIPPNWRVLALTGSSI